MLLHLVHVIKLLKYGVLIKKITCIKKNIKKNKVISNFYYSFFIIKYLIIYLTLKI